MLRHFNSIKVRLEPSIFYGQSRTIRNFNSIKVRLEQGNREAHIRGRGFQFHKGTIRTKGVRPFPNIDRNFNSIKVRLELSDVLNSSDCHLHFNSIKVRLELHVSKYANILLLFQFHKGTIRTYYSYLFG